MAAINDWIVAGLNNPGWTTRDFATIADMNVDNTQLLSVDDYLKSDYIKQQDIFKDDVTGKFSEKKFREYYNVRVRDFGELQDNEFYRGPALDMFDIFATPESTVKDIKFDIRRGVNPDRQAIGIEGVNVWSDPVFSQRELAKQNKVYNYTTGKYEDYTVNDHALVRKPLKWLEDVFGFKDPLVMAAWDEDGTHVDPLTGMTKTHQKGELKLNDKGTYYYETLGGRSVLGKDVLSVFDTFTVDGEGLNKYDFFDSNDIKKSLGGTIARNIASILPMFMGPVGQVYAGAMIVREITKSIPMLYGMVTAFDDTDTPGWLNALAAYGTSWTSSTSDWAKSHMWAAENIANMISEVALQWGQQQLIAEALGRLRGTKSMVAAAREAMEAERLAKGSQYVTAAERAAFDNALVNKYLVPAQEMASKAGQMGRDMSLAYMAIVSNTDVYQDMLDHGTTKLEAATVALGSSLGMFAVDKFLGLGELFFDDATGDVTKQARAALKKELTDARDVFKMEMAKEAPVANKLMGLMKRSSETAQRALTDFASDLRYHTLGAFGKMLGEGMEEVGEEVVADCMKSLYEVARQFGFDTSTEDVGAWDNAFQRYLMNFLGGFTGGGIFYGVGVWNRGTFHRPDLDMDIANLIRNGHADELRSQLGEMYNEGRTGSKSLSALDFERMEDGKIVWRTTADPSRTQGQVVRDLVNQRINAIEEVLVTDNVNMTDDELFDNMVLTEKRYLRYKDIAPLTNYYNDFNTQLKKLINAEINLRLAESSPDGNPLNLTTATDSDYRNRSKEMQDVINNNIAPHRAAAETAKAEMEAFLSGETSLDYTRKLNFLMDSTLHEPFLLNTDQKSYYASKHNGANLNEMPFEERLRFLVEEWNPYVSKELKDHASEAWARFKDFETKFLPTINAIAADGKKYKTWAMKVEGLFGENGVLSKSPEHWGTNTTLEGETDEEVQNIRVRRMNADTGELETDEELQKRLRDRWDRIEQHNDEVDKNYADRVLGELAEVGYVVDPQTLRLIRIVMDDLGTQRAILRRKMALHDFDDTTVSALATLKPDLSNRTEVMGILRDAYVNDAKIQISNLLNAFTSTELEWSENGETKRGNLTAFIAGHDGLEQMSVADMLASLNLVLSGKPLDDEITRLRGEGTPQANMTIDSLEHLRSLSNSDKSLLRYLLSEMVSYGEEADRDEGTGEFVREDGVDYQRASDILVRDLADETIGAMEMAGVARGIAMEREARASNELATFFRQVNDNPLFKLRRTLKTSVKNPITEGIKAMAAANGDEIEDVDRILELLTDRFESLNNANELILNNAEQNNLVKAQGYLRLYKAYIYAASTLPNSQFPFGHNKTANSFAQSHSDRFLSAWEVLPEIDSDYVTSLLNSTDRYLAEIDLWLERSRTNDMNKTRKVAKTDEQLSKALWKVVMKINPTFQLNGHTYDLLKGRDKISTASLNTSQAQVPLYQLTQLLHDNIAQIAIENHMTVSELFKTTDILSNLIPDVKSAYGNRKNADINPDIKAEDFSTFDKLVYLATIVSRDPSEFFKALDERVKKNADFVPVAAQELAAQVVYASVTDTFKDIMEVAYSKLGSNRPAFLKNMIIVPGRAGVGKTSVIAQFIAELFRDKEKKTIFVGAPYDNQAQKLAKTMGVNTSYSKQNFFNDIFGKTVYEEVMKEMRTMAVVSDANPTYDGKYLSAKYDGVGSVHVFLKPDAFKFKSLGGNSLFVFDEATHLNTVEALMLDAYCEATHSQGVLCGDMVQMGHMIETKPTDKSKITNHLNFVVANIDEMAVFAARTPNLTLSFRNDNAQKVNNENCVRGLAETMRDKRLFGTTSDYAEYAPIANAEIKKIKFQVYRDAQEINGDLITKDLDQSTLDLLRTASETKDVTVGFLGDDSSPILAKMREAGIKIALVNGKDNHTLGNVQGQEFSYLVIDHRFTVPSDKSAPSTLRFINELYTLMSRARTASIFIDRNLSDIIGGNETSMVKAKAPSVKDGIKELRGQKIITLQQIMDLVNNHTTIIVPEPTRPKTPPTPPTTPPTTPPAPPTPEAPPTETPPPAPESTPPTEPPTTEAPPAGETTTPESETTVTEDIPEPTEEASSAEKNPPAAEPNRDELFNDPFERESTDPIDEDMQALVNEDRAQYDGAETDTETPFDNMSPLDALAAFGDGDSPVETFTNFYYLGVKRGKNKVTVPGKEYMISGHEWSIETPQTRKPLRNLQALLSDPNPESRTPYTYPKVLSYSDKLEWQKMLATVRSFIIFGHTAESFDVEDNPLDFGEQYSFFDRFSKDFVENGHYELELRPADDSEQRPLHSPGTEVGFIYKGDDRVIAEIVFVTTDKLGRECRFDIGAFTDPNRLMDEEVRANFKANLRAKLANMPDGDRKTKLQNMHDNIDSAAKRYSDWFSAFYSHYDGEHIISVRLPEGSVSLNRCTWLRKGPTIRLGGRVNPDNLDASDPAELMRNLKDQNPDCVFSDIYTYSGEDSESSGIDPSLKGRAFILVSSDMLLRPDQLINTYIQQKSDPANSDPVVRCIMLDNYGETFSQLMSTEFADVFQGGKRDNMQFKMNATGVRMFTALWNARAAIKQVNEAVRNWANGRSDEEIMAMARAQDVWYQNGGTTDSKVLSVLQPFGLASTVEEADDIVKEFNRLNNEVLLNIPMFRIGYTRTAGLTHHISQFDVTSSTAYEPSKTNPRTMVNLCVLSIEKARQFEKILDAVLTPILQTNTALESEGKGDMTYRIGLETTFYKCDADGNIIGSFADNEFIDPYSTDPKRKGSHRRSISGLMHIDGGKVKLTDPNGNEIIVAKGDGWSVIPRMLMYYARKVLALQHNGWDADTNMDTRVLFYTYSSENGKTVQHENALVMSVADLFDPAEGVIAESKTTDGDGKLIDHTFMDVLDLVFHGTTEDIHRRVGDGKIDPVTGERHPMPLMKMTDAYFPNGFYINPDIIRKQQASGDKEQISGVYGRDGRKILFFNIGTNPALFTANVAPRISGVAVSINALLGIDVSKDGVVHVEGEPETVPTATTVSVTETVRSFEEEHPAESQIIGILNELNTVYKWGEFSMNEDGMAAALPRWKSMQANAIVNMYAAMPDISIDEILEIPYIGFVGNISSITPLNDVINSITTFGQYLRSIYPDCSLERTPTGLSVRLSDGRSLAVKAVETTEGWRLVIGTDMDTVLENGITSRDAIWKWLDSKEYENLKPRANASEESIAKFATVKKEFIDIMNSMFGRGGFFTQEELDRIGSEEFVPIHTALASVDKQLEEMIFDNCKISR